MQAEILALLEDSLAQGRSIILISHDLAVVERLADHVLVMKHGRVVEQGPTHEVLTHPQHTTPSVSSPPSRRRTPAGSDCRDTPPQTAADPRPQRSRAPLDAGPVLSVQGVTKRYRGPDGRHRTVVDDVSFDLHAGETLGIVGESGSGKSTTAWMSLALTAPSAGQVLLDGRPWSGLPERRRRGRRRRISVVHQDSLGSFDPRWTVGRIIADALPGDVPRAQHASRVEELLDSVGLTGAHAVRHPLSLSGGQRQRVSIARALATGPEILVLDEPVSALDVSIQAQVLDLLVDLQRTLGTAYLFISHDLGVIHHLSDRVLVMQGGRIVESGSADDVFFAPQHDYTRQLVSALPSPRLEEIA